MPRLIRAAAALAALGLLAALARRLVSPPPPGEPTTAAEPGPVPAPAPQTTRRELYEEARRLEIKGRSKMSKAELIQAVTAAKKGER